MRKAGQHLDELASARVGTVTVGTHLAGSNVLLPRAIARLKRERPRVTVIVREATPDTLQAELLTGRIDLMVGRLTTPVGHDQLLREQMYQEPVRLVTRAGHPARDLPSPGWADLLGYPWIVPVRETSLREELEQVFFAEGIPLPENRVECTCMLTLKTLLVETDAIAALPVLVATGSDDLALLPPLLPSVRRPVGVTLPRDRPAGPAANLLLGCLHAVAAEIRERL
ncbi:LysR substrate-binding domain-containing protein [Amycolatopsis samaneae]|uniref:LysR substrate-binding domain-containing protein n=1 Tax=Amycolatopsis samaneae TaxID=664691 RepID=A0ABW5GR83_9PSEU